MNPAPPPAPAPSPARVAAIDAYRGLVMFLMLAEVLRLSRVANALPAGDPSKPAWEFFAHQQTHVEWAGCTLHDLIQPSFSFLVGLALPFSLLVRSAGGQPFFWTMFHAFRRAVILIFLGVFLRSVGQAQTNWTFTDTLSQIGLGYFFLFLLGYARPRWQWAALGVILVGYWAAFVSYEKPSGLDMSAIGAKPDWPYGAEGFDRHWNKNTNIAAAVDRWFLNLFPREKPFLNNPGGYATLSFVPTLGTMILGLIAGGWLLRPDTPKQKLARLGLTGLALLAAGLVLDLSGVCPSVKRIWTPAWVLFSGGWCFLLLSAFYAVTDVAGYARWTFPLRVIGANSIAAYCMAHLIEPFLESTFKTHFGQDVFPRVCADIGLPAAAAPFVAGVMVLSVYWLILLWMYSRRIFLRI